MIPGEDGELAEMSQKNATLWYAARTLAGRREPRRVFHGHLPAQRASRRYNGEMWLQPAGVTGYASREAAAP